MKLPYQDPYCYPHTNVLINLADIRDRVELEGVEAALTASQASIILDKPSRSHDLKQLLFIHHTLFGKLYPFAGKLRIHTGRMTKTRPNGSTVVYCDSSFVQTQLDQLFHALAEEDYLRASKPDQFARRAAYFYGELDAIHSFREGNSRTLRLFFYGLAKSAGFALDWETLGVSEDGRQRLYAARDLAVMKGDSSALATIFAAILSAL